MPKEATKKGKAPVAKTGGTEVAISTLTTLQSFKYKGQIYTKRRASPTSVVGLAQKGDKLVTLSPDTLVTPI